MSITVNQTWSQDKAKNLQKLLNQYGFKDEMGNPLAEDGIAGPKTQQALAKMNTYQQNLTKPDASTAAWQEQLNDWGYRDANGNQLKVDGVYGPKTDAAMSEFENGFFDGFSEGKDPKKTVPTQTYPTMPKASDDQIIATVTPDYNTTGYEWQKSHTAAGNYGYALLPGETTFSQKQQPLKTGLTGLKAEAGGAIPTSTGSGTQPQTSQPYVYPDYLDYAKDAGVTSNFNGGGLMRDQMKKPDLSGIDFTRPLSSEDQNKVRQAIEIEKQQQAIDTLNMNEAGPKYEQAKYANAPDANAWQKKYMDSMDAVTAGQKQIDDYYAKLKAGTQTPAAPKPVWVDTDNQTQDKKVLVSDINAMQDWLNQNNGVDLSDPANKDAVRVVQSLLGLPEDGQWSDAMQQRLQNYLTQQNDQFANDYTFTAQNMKSLQNGYFSKYYEIKNATDYVNSNLDRMVELAGKDTLTADEQAEAKKMLNNIQTYSNAYQDVQQKAIIDPNNNRQLYDLITKLGLIAINLNLKTDSHLAEAGGSTAELPFAKSAFTSTYEQNAADWQKRMAGWSAEDVQKYGKMVDGLKDMFATAQKAFPGEYLDGQINSLATQTAVTGLAGKGIVAAADVASVLARNGVPKVLIPKALDALTGIITGYYNLLRDASMSDYDKSKLANDIVTTLRSAGLGGIVDGILSKGNEAIEFFLDFLDASKSSFKEKS